MMNARRMLHVLSLLIVSMFSATFPAQATAQTKTTIQGGPVTTASALWAEVRPNGTTLYTQLDVLNGVVFVAGQEPSFGQGTTIMLSRTALDAQGNIVFTDDDFFGQTYTTARVFQADQKLQTATLAPVEVKMCEYDDVGNCAVVLKRITVQTAWTGTGALATTTTRFKEAGTALSDRYRVTFNGSSQARPTSARGTVNQQPFATASLSSTLARTAKVTVIVGTLSPLGISHTDYMAPTVTVGNKIVRGGEGSLSSASWVQSSSGGGSVRIDLSVSAGFGYQGRIPVFFNGTFVGVSKSVFDANGNLIDFMFGDISLGSDVWSIKNNLSKATLSPVTLTICGFEDRDETFTCVAGETITVQATWTAVAPLVKDERFRFTAITNCDANQCSTVDQRRSFKVKATGSGASRDASATVSINGVALGQSVIDPQFGGAFLVMIKRSTIQYGGTYPFDIYLIQVP